MTSLLSEARAEAAAQARRAAALAARLEEVEGEFTAAAGQVQVLTLQLEQS